MKLRSLALVIVFLLMSFSVALAVEDVTGVQWLELSAGQRMDHIRMSMAVLGYHGVKLKGTANDYYNEVSQKLRADPGLFSWELTQILATLATEKKDDKGTL